MSLGPDPLNKSRVAERAAPGGDICSAGKDPLAAVRGAIERLAIEHRPLDRLHPNPKNARTHSARQIAKIAASIRAFGFLSPIVVDGSGLILAGHGRYAAARELGLMDMPVILAAHLTEAEKRLFALAENRLAELAGWDEELLTIELKDLEGITVDLDIEITGFDTVDIDRLISRESQERSNPDDLIPEVNDGSPPVTRRGDLWLLGGHKLLCGDALSDGDYAALLGAERAQMVFTDPPYNVPIPGHVTSRDCHRNFLMASGEMTPDEFRAFLHQALGHLRTYSVDGSIHYVCTDWRHIPEVLTAASGIYGPPKNLAVWVKDNAGMGTFYRSQHELVFVFKAGDGPHINNFGLGARGRYRTNVWQYPGVNMLRQGRSSDLAMHPTVKPSAMVVDAIKDCSHRKGIVVDSFAGSGTTLIAAERTGRLARIIELDPHYCDVIVRRWEAFSETPARLEADRQSFDEVARGRSLTSSPPAVPKPAEHGTTV
jgi:16S rRNA G966 N2-methylase RsmD